MEKGMVDIRPLGGQLARVAWTALRSFVGTLALLSAAGIALAVVSFYFLRDHPVYGALAAVIAGAEGVATGVVLGAKRGVVMALAQALGELRLARAVVRLVFGRLLGVAEGEEHGERGGRVARAAERLPLAEAERRLTGVVRDVAGETGKGGWLRRTIQARLLALVQKYTLARFREEDAAHGGVDLLKLKDDLEGRVDDALVKKVRGGLRLWTVLAVIGLPAVVAFQTYLVIALLHAKG
jgi:hypothetical protein